MPRLLRAVAVGYPHHVTQRGNYQQPVFEKTEDYEKYLQWLTEYSRKYSLKIWAYCLMTNHVHFVVVPAKDDALARTFNTLHMRYAQYYNRKTNSHGHLWQGRYFSCVLDEGHLYAAMRYVENNPARAGIVQKASEYKWSSAHAHISDNVKVDPVLSDDCFLTKEIKNWKEYLLEQADGSRIRNIRENTKAGRPCGDENFVKQVETLLGKRLTALPRGRPYKNKT